MIDMKEQEFTKKLEAAAGTLAFPHFLYFDQSGNVVKVEYEKQWKEGGTTPVEDESGNITGYKEDYKKQSLTDAQIAAVDKLIASIK